MASQMFEIYDANGKTHRVKGVRWKYVGSDEILIGVTLPGFTRLSAAPGPLTLGDRRIYIPVEERRKVTFCAAE
jgi:hypothetical protein